MYFIYCDSIDKNNNLFNSKKSDLLATFDVSVMKKSAIMLLHHSLFMTSTDSHVNGITLNVRDQGGELFYFSGLPIEFELEIS